jgi:hypothetical protein
VRRILLAAALLSLGSPALAQETTASLVAQGYEVKATIGGFIIVQRDTKVFVCDVEKAIMNESGAKFVGSISRASCYAL